jgi:hypothetical protein
MHNLAYTGLLLDCQRPSLVVSMKIAFHTLSWSWMEGLLALGCHPFVCC